MLAFGPSHALDALEAWLAMGPPQARVEQVLREPLDSEPDASGFSVG